MPHFYLLTIYLLFLSWIFLHARHHFVRIAQGWVMSPNVFTVFILLYSLWLYYVIHRPLIWSIQLLLLSAPWTVMFLIYQPRETYYLERQGTVQLTSGRWRSSHPEQVSKVRTTFLASFYGDRALQQRLGYLLVDNQRITDVEHDRVILNQEMHLLFDRSNDAFQTKRVWTGPIALCRERHLPLPSLYSTRLSAGSGKYADVAGEVFTEWIEEEGEGLMRLTVWFE